MKTLCLGGSFNPIHHGHLICALAAAEWGEFGRIRLVPSGNPPHKPADPTLADASHRLAMCQLAAKSAIGDLLEVSAMEITTPGPSYTIETVRKMKQQGEKNIAWLIGADMLKILPKWHQAAELLNEVDFYILERPGAAIDWNSLPPGFAKLKQNLVPAPLIDISATQIRQRVRDGKPIDFFTPSPVVRYIAEQKLYRS